MINDINGGDGPNRSGNTDPQETVAQAETDHLAVIHPPKKPWSLPRVLAFTVIPALLIALVVAFINPKGPADSDFSSSQSMPWIVAIGALLIAAISLGISFWLYYVRALYLKDGPALVPERWGALLAEVCLETSNSRKSTVSGVSALLKDAKQQEQRIDTLLESFLTLQHAISSRDDEIKRLKKGHDAKIFKRFVNRFIKTSIAIDQIKNDSTKWDDSKNIIYIARLLENALDECGVIKIMPELNTDYRNLGAEVADDPDVFETEDESLNFKIADVKSPAYVIEGEGDSEVLIPANVVIYKTKNTIKES